MQELAGINIEEKLYIDKKGKLTGEADFVILEGGIRGGIFKNKNQINVNDYIHFTTEFNSFRKPNIAKTIFQQILSVYNQSLLKKYNESISFIPFLEHEKGKGGFSVSTFTINLSKELIAVGTLDKSDYRYGKDMDQISAVFGKDHLSKDSKEIEDIDIEDLEFYIQNIPITFIPKYYFLGEAAKEANVQTLNPPFGGTRHILYSKSDLLKDLNKIGSFLSL